MLERSAKKILPVNVASWFWRLCWDRRGHGWFFFHCRERIRIFHFAHKSACLYSQGWWFYLWMLVCERYTGFFFPHGFTSYHELLALQALFFFLWQRAEKPLSISQRIKKSIEWFLAVYVLFHWSVGCSWATTLEFVFVQSLIWGKRNCYES